MKKVFIILLVIYSINIGIGNLIVRQNRIEGATDIREAIFILQEKTDDLEKEMTRLRNQVQINCIMIEFLLDFLYFYHQGIWLLSYQIIPIVI